MANNAIKVLGFKQTLKANGNLVDWVNFTSSDGMTDTGEPAFATWVEIKRITPPEYIENDDGGLKMAALRSQWAQVEPAYKAWPALSGDEAEGLRTVGIKTVEEVANLSEDRLARPVLPRLRELQRQAKVFIAGMGNAALEAKIAQLEEQNAAMLEMLAEKEMADDKPRRGRPPKVKEDEAA